MRRRAELRPEEPAHVAYRHRARGPIASEHHVRTRRAPPCAFARIADDQRIRTGLETWSETIRRWLVRHGSDIWCAAPAVGAEREAGRCCGDVFAGDDGDVCRPRPWHQPEHAVCLAQIASRRGRVSRRTASGNICCGERQAGSGWICPRIAGGGGPWDDRDIFHERAADAHHGRR